MLGFNPLASAPLSDDGIVVVSSSISLSGVASQVIHNDVVGVNSSNKSISNVSSQVTQGSLSTTVDITLSSTSTTGQLGTISQVIGILTTLDSVSTTSQAGTTAGSTSSNKAVTSVSSTGSVNDSSVSISSNKSVTSVSATGQVRTPQIGPSENLVAVSVTGNVTSPSLVVSSSLEINQVTSTSQVGSLVGTTDEIGNIASVSSTVSVSSVETTAVSTETLSSLSSTLSASDLSLTASSNKSLVNVSSSTTVNNLVVVINNETSLSGVSSSVDVNGLPYVGIPVNATVNFNVPTTSNLYYSGRARSGSSLSTYGVIYTSVGGTRYSGTSVEVSLDFKVDSSASDTEIQYLFESRNSAYNNSGYNNDLHILRQGSSIEVGLTLISSLLRKTYRNFTLNYSFSKEVWYRITVYNNGQRLYAQVHNAVTGQLLHSENSLMSVSYGSFSSTSYNFWLGYSSSSFDFTLGTSPGYSSSTRYFDGLLHNVNLSVPRNTLRAKVWSQRTSVSNPSSSIPGAHVNPSSDWADAQSNFSNNASNGSTAATSDIPVFESPSSLTTINQPTSVTTSTSVNGVTAIFSSSVSAFPTGVSSSAQAQTLEETLVSSSKTLDSTSSVAVLTPVTQVHSSNKTLPSADFTSSVNDVDKIASSSVLLDTTNSQASVTDLVSLTTDVLTGVSSSVTFNSLSVNLSAPLTTVSSTSQVSDLVVDIDEIIPPSLSVSSQVSAGQLNAGGGTTLSSISTSSEINPVVLGVLLEKVEAEVTLTPVVIGVPITGVSSSSQANALEAIITELIDGVSSSASVNSVTPVSNGSTTLDSVSSTVLTDTSTPNQLSVSTDEVANLTGVEAGTAVSFGGVESNKAILRKVTTLCQVGTLTINVGVTLPSASFTSNASDQVKGVINASVQLSTLPLVTVGRGSITLSTDGFNFEEFKNAYDRARTVYISRAA